MTREDVLELAAYLFIKELMEVCEAEMEFMAINRSLEVRKRLDAADALMDKGWDLLENIGMTNSDISILRHEAHKSYAKRMGWDTDRPLIVKDRAYPIG